MKIGAIKWINGYVSCSLRGKYIELFINMAIKNQIHIWDISMQNNEQAVFSISVDDFFKLRPIVKKTYTRIHVMKRGGLPFLVKKLNNRKGIVFGLILFLLIIQVFSSLIWTINIKGNQTIKIELVYQVIEDLGIHRGMFKYQLPDNKVIQNHLQQNLDDAAWIGVSIRGTNIDITIVEKVRPNKLPLANPRDVISTKDAIIYRILSDKGIPKVKVNDRVKKGDILISGLMGDEEKNETVIADGIVKGIVWYESEITMPLKQKWKEYTGNIIERKYISIGNRMIKFNSSSEIPYDNYHKKYNWNRLSWRSYHFPVGIITEKKIEYKEKERKLTRSEALQLGIQQMKKELFNKIARDSQILSEKVLHRSFENDKVTIKMLFEVIEDITTTQPIIQGD